MTTYIRCLSYLISLCILSLLAGCGEEPISSVSAYRNSGDIILSLKVSIGNSKSLGGTRAEPFESTDNPYELMHTLRVIIMREDNTVEFNRMTVLSDGVGLEKISDLRFDVSTSLGEIIRNPDTNVLTRTEKKRIYLVANEYSIPDGDVRNLLETLKEGYYQKIEKPDIPPESEERPESEEENLGNIEANYVYVPGETFLPERASELVIFNDWITPDQTTQDTYAKPFVDNEGKPDGNKKFVPMTEFFDISVTSNLTKPNDTNVQKEDLFITRNLVKFQFTINATEESESFKVIGIRFYNLMQKEYLFPNDTKYEPAKYSEDGIVNTEDKIITQYNTPGMAGNLVEPCLFQPKNFGYNSKITGRPATGYNPTYYPELYFCESTNKVGDENKKSVFSVGIDVEFPFTEPMLDNKGEPVLDESGNQIMIPVIRKFESKDPLDLPDGLPRNTIVKVNMKLNNGDLSAVATVFPYTAVSLNPEFGFTAPETDRLTVKPTMELELNGADGLLYPNFTSSADNTIQNLYWVSSNPSIVLLSNEVTEESDQRYIEPSASIELPYLQEVQDKLEPVPVRIVPKGVGTTNVTVYTQSGLVARCRVTVK